MTIHIRPLCNALGAEVIGVDMCQPIDGEAFAEIYAAWLQHNILLFRGQKIDIPQQITFAARFGALELPGAAINVHPEYPEILVFSNVKVDGNNQGKLPEGSRRGLAQRPLFPRQTIKRIAFLCEGSAAGRGGYIFRKPNGGL